MYRLHIGGGSVAGDTIFMYFGGGTAGQGTLAVFYTLSRFEMGEKAHPPTQAPVTAHTVSLICANLP